MTVIEVIVYSSRVSLQTTVLVHLLSPSYSSREGLVTISQFPLRFRDTKMVDGYVISRNPESWVGLSLKLQNDGIVYILSRM